MDYLDPPNLLTWTEFGNFGVVAPSCLLVTLWLWRFWSGAVALLYAVNFALVIFATVVLKYLFDQAGGAFHDSYWQLSHAAPSGHMAGAMVCYGAAAALLAGGGGGVSRLIGALALALLAVFVGYTRVALNAHTVADVVVAGLLGLPLLPAMYFVARRQRVSADAGLGLFLTVLACACAMQLAGVRFDSTSLL